MKRKVMHLLASNSYSGAENVVISLIQQLSDEFDCYYVSPDGTIAKNLKEKGIAFVPLQKLSFSNVKKAIQQIEPDVIHAHDFTASIIAAAVGKEYSVLSHLHQNPSWLGKFNLKSVAYGVSARRFQKIITVSNQIEDEFIFAKQFDGKFKVIENTVNTQSVVALAKEQVSTEQYDVVYLGRFADVKNPMKFIQLVEKLQKKIVPFKAIMIGDGPLLAECTDYIQEHQLNISLTGFQTNPYPYLASGKLLVVTSEWEGFGLAAVEALALGKPVIATPVGGLNSIITEECGGLRKSTKEMMALIEVVLSDEKLYHKLSVGAVERADLYNDLDKWKEAFAAEYQK